MQINHTQHKELNKSPNTSKHCLGGWACRYRCQSSSLLSLPSPTSDILWLYRNETAKPGFDEQSCNDTQHHHAGGEGLQHRYQKLCLQAVQLLQKRSKRMWLITPQPFLSSSFFLAASSLCFRMMASRARSALACSVLPARCIFMYLSFAFCFSISSLFEWNTAVVRICREACRCRCTLREAFWLGWKASADRLPTKAVGPHHHFSSTSCACCGVWWEMERSRRFCTFSYITALRHNEVKGITPRLHSIITFFHTSR